jgi:hypothetical protein
MATLLLGVALFIFVLYMARMLVNADPHLLVKNLRRGGGVAALAGAAVLTATGRFAMAIPLGFLGLGLLGLLPGRTSFGAHTQRSSGQTSNVRSSAVEMELDHDSGDMHGRFITGKYAGVTLEALDLNALLSVLSELDEESRALLEAYLDRRDSAWREHVQEDPGLGAGEPARKGPMSEEEARQILGVEPGASPVEISRAHRTLMKKLHPDQGGSTYLAARVNEAKEILLRSHH